MAVSLWDRISSTSDDRVPTHLIVAGYRAYFINGIDSSKGATKANILAAINSHVETPMSACAQTDLDNIADQIDLQANNTAKLIYIQGLEWTFMAAEFGEITESKFRSDLDISAS